MEFAKFKKPVLGNNSSLYSGFSRPRGFALIELIVAMTLLSFLISLLVFIYLQTLKTVESGERRGTLENSAQILLDQIVNEISRSNLLRASPVMIRIGDYEKVGNEKVEILGKGKFLKPVYEERPVTYEKKGVEILRNGKSILPKGMRVETLQFDYWGYDSFGSLKGRVGFAELDRNRDGELFQGEERMVTTIQVFLEISRGSHRISLKTTKRLNPVLGDAIVKSDLTTLTKD